MQLTLIWRCMGFLPTACYLASAQTSPLSTFPPAPFNFSGKWACRGMFRTGKPHEATFTGDVVVGGKWLELPEVDTLPATG